MTNTMTSSPAHMRIAEQLRERIASGAWAPAARLPAERMLATQLGVSRMTVRQALAALQLEGRISRRTGRSGGTTAATALIRPEDIDISPTDSADTRPGLAGVVHSSVLRGSLSSVYVDVAELPHPVRVDLSTAQASAFAPGADVSLQLLRSEAVLEPASPATASGTGGTSAPTASGTDARTGVSA